MLVERWEEPQGRQRQVQRTIAGTDSAVRSEDDVRNSARITWSHGEDPWFGALGRANLLFWDDAGEHTRGPWRLYGGHRLWTTRPDADESEEAVPARR